MQNYPYNPALLHTLNALRDEFIANAKLAIQRHLNLGKIDIYDSEIFVSEYDVKPETLCVSTSVEHDNFLLARVLVGNSLI